MVRRSIPVLLMLCLPLAAGCASNEPAPIPGESVTIDGTTTSSAAAPTPEAGGTAPSGVAPGGPSPAGSDDGDAGELPAKPAADECVTIPESENGRYRVYDAGTAVVRHTGNRLQIGAIKPSKGWSYRIDSQDRDEAKIDFRSGRTELSLEIELDDGQVEAQICHDVDDADDD